MNGSIKTDRRYTLGDYKYATMEDYVTDIPDYLYFDSNFLSTLRFLQLLSFEIAYRRYVQLVSKFPHSMDIEQATKELEAIREKELVSIKALLNGKLSHEPTTEE
jgi:hypothetical protein